MPTVQTETATATPTKPPAALSAYVWTSLCESALTSTSAVACTIEVASMYACVVDVGDADVDAAGDADEPAGDAAGDREALEGVDRRDVDRLGAARAAEVVVDLRAARDERLGDDVEERDADAAGDADEAAAGAGGEAEDVLARRRLDGDAAERRRSAKPSPVIVAVVDVDAVLPPSSAFASTLLLAPM